MALLPFFTSTPWGRLNQGINNLMDKCVFMAVWRQTLRGFSYVTLRRWEARGGHVVSQTLGSTSFLSHKSDSNFCINLKWSPSCISSTRNSRCRSVCLVLLLFVEKKKKEKYACLYVFNFLWQTLRKSVSGCLQVGKLII